MTLAKRIAEIVAIDCLSPAERAEMILAQPGLKLRCIRIAVANAVALKRADIAEYDRKHAKFIADGGGHDQPA